MEEVKLIEYLCKTCSTKFYTSKDNITNCIFCNSNNIDNNSVTMNNSISVVPFKVELKDAIKNYKKKTRLNPLVPFIFKKNENINNIKKIYLPAYISDIKCEGDISFYAADNNLDNKYEVVEKVNFDYDDIVLKASSKVDDILFEEINDYTINEVIDIDNNNLDDSIYLVNNISFEDMTDITKDKVSKYSIKMIKNSINHNKKKLKENNTNITFNNNRKLLVPIYLLDIKYKDKNYYYIMNGQTSSSYINIPIGILETVLFSGLLFGIVFLISFLISYFL